MPHSFNKLWIHTIWATKNRYPFVQPNIEKDIHQFISKQLREQGCPVRIINGMPDHIHCLFLLNPQKSIAEVMKQLKGSSSHFVNQNNLTPDKFSWQTGYAAFSIFGISSRKGISLYQQPKKPSQKANLPTGIRTIFKPIWI